MAKQTSLNRILNNIITDIRSTTKSALEYAGQRISGDFGLMAYLALDSYYNEFKKPPRQYERTGILMNDSYRKVNNINGFSVKAGVEFDDTLMHHDNFHSEKITEAMVLENFMSGYHGWEGHYDGEFQRAKMDKYFNDYVRRNQHYKYFKDYMDTHLNK